MQLSSIFKQQKLFFTQLISLGVIAIVFVFTSGWLGFKSVVLGGSAWILPSWYFTQRLQRIKITYNVRKMLKVFFLGEAVKLLISFGIIVLVLWSCVIDRIGFISGYIAIVLVSLLIPFWDGIKND